MKTITSFWQHSLKLLLLLLFSFQAIAATEATDQIIVGFDSTSANGQLRALGLSKKINKSLVYVRNLATGDHVYRLPGKEDLPAVQGYARALQAISGVKFAEADQIMHAGALSVPPNDTYYQQYQWHYQNTLGGINAPSAWSQFSTLPSNPVYVAVVDTGYRPHRDLINNLATDGQGKVIGADLIGVYSSVDVANDGDGRDMDPLDPGDWNLQNECGGGSQPQDSSWHGTHTAGTIAAQTHNNDGVSGVTYNMAKVIPVRVLGKCGGYLSDIADGILWAVGKPITGLTTNPYPARVINMSLGGSGSCGTTYQTAIDQAINAGASVVVSAGNANADASNFRPANCNKVITIAATNTLGQRSYYSNYGAIVDIAAPGGDANGYILSTLNSGTTTPGADVYGFYQGTSMSAPHVSAVVALMLLKNSQLTPAELESLIKSASRSFPSGCSGCGAGLLDAGLAVAAASGVQPPALPTMGTLSAADLMNGSALLSWPDSDSETSYQLQRQKKNKRKWTGWADIVLPAQNQTQYTDNSGTGTFLYRIRALNEVGASEWSTSNEVNVTDSSGGSSGGGGPKTCHGKKCP